MYNLIFVIIRSYCIYYILNVIMIKRYGIWGAAFATLICFVFKAGMTYYYSNRLYRISVEWRRVGTLFAGAIGLFLAGSMVETGSLWLNAAAKFGVGLTYPLLLYWMKMFDRSEIAKIKEIIRTRRLSVD